MRSSLWLTLKFLLLCLCNVCGYYTYKYNDIVMQC
jgi:hypothetical protein